MHHLITGGAGFVGAHLTEKLLSEGHRVTIIDNLSTGNLQNIRDLEGHENLEIVVDSILGSDDLPDLVRDCDLIYHLAAAVGVQLIVDRPVETIKTNISGTEIVLGLANRYRKPIVLTSTSEVYGKSSQPVFSEDADMVFGNTKNTRWSYACSKAIDEFLSIAYHRSHGLPVIIVRLFNTVGPKQTGQYGMVLPRFAQQALKGQKLTVYGTGSQTRTFTHIDDVIRGLIRLPEVDRCYGEVFNIGGKEEITISDLAQLVIQSCGSSSELSHVPYREAYAPGFEDMERRVPDIRKIKTFIDFEPKKTLQDMVTDVIAYQKSLVNPSNA